MTPMIVFSTGPTLTGLAVFVSAFLDVFLGGLLAGTLNGRFFRVLVFAALPRAWRTWDFAFFGVVRFAAFLRAGLTVALLRFELFLRVAPRVFALAMLSPVQLCRRQANNSKSRLLTLSPNHPLGYFYPDQPHDALLAIAT
jgi:hypothetical protein